MIDRQQIGGSASLPLSHPDAAVLYFGRVELHAGVVGRDLLVVGDVESNVVARADNFLTVQKASVQGPTGVGALVADGVDRPLNIRQA
jgi:hypothetical protein